MYPFNLPYLDFNHLTDAIIERIHQYHGSEDFLDFSNMPEEEMDHYIEVWLAHLPANCLEEFYNDAMCNNTLMKDTILQVYSSPKEKAETEKDLIRREFLRPSLNPQDSASWAQKIEECVNCVIENQWRVAV